MNRDIIIKNGTVYDGRGNIFYHTDILLENGMIKDIAKNISVDDKVKIYDATDKVIMPGFIESLNVWGCTGPGWGDNDLNELSDPITPQLNVVFSFDQDNMMFQRVFEYGITSVGITPSTSNVIGGFAAAYKTFGFHPYDMLIKEKIAMVGSVSRETTKVYKDRNMAPTTKMGSYSLLREALIKAKIYNPKKCNYDAKSLALKSVINKKIPLFINCNTSSEIFALNMLLKEFDVDLVLTGAYGVGNLSDLIIKNKYNIILGDITNGMSSSSENLNFEEVKLLYDKGITMAISSCGDRISSGKESLIWNAILFYKNGLTSNDVLQMITYNPAKILGIEDKVGSLEIGKDADITIWTDNPIERYNSRLTEVFVNGESILDLRRVNSCW